MPLKMVDLEPQKLLKIETQRRKLRDQAFGIFEEFVQSDTHFYWRGFDVEFSRYAEERFTLRCTISLNQDWLPENGAVLLDRRLWQLLDSFHNAPHPHQHPHFMHFTIQSVRKECMHRSATLIAEFYRPPMDGPH